MVAVPFEYPGRNVVAGNAIASSPDNIVPRKQDQVMLKIDIDGVPDFIQSAVETIVPVVIHLQGCIGAIPLSSVSIVCLC
jgi:hypothetical protein